jgi:hypothetical protein
MFMKGLSWRAGESEDNLRYFDLQQGCEEE